MKDLKAAIMFSLLGLFILTACSKSWDAVKPASSSDSTSGVSGLKHPIIFTVPADPLVICNPGNGNNTPFKTLVSGKSFREISHPIISGSVKVAFEADGNIWSVNMDGSNLKQLTKTGDNNYPVFGPEDQILFSSMRSGKSQLYIITENGHIQEIETERPVFESSILENPDSNAWKIISCTGRGDNSAIVVYKIVQKGANHSYMAQVDSEVLHDGEITGTSIGVRTLSAPAGSADGKTLVAIAQQPDNSYQLININIETGKVATASHFKSGVINQNAYPHFSPDDKFIIFTSIKEEYRLKAIEGKPLSPYSYTISISNSKYTGGFKSNILGYASESANSSLSSQQTSNPCWAVIRTSPPIRY